MQLTSRTGPYAISLTEEPARSADSAPYVRVRIVNHGRRPIVLGGSPEHAQVMLSFVSPRARGTEVIYALPAGRTETIRPGSHLAFHFTFPYRLGAPGVYRFNVSYDHVDSNILTYRFKARA